MITTVHGQTAFTTTTEVSYDYLEVQGVFAYRRVEGSVSNNPAVEPSSSSQQGIIDAKGVEVLKSGVMPEHVGSFSVLDDDALALVHRFGYSALSDRHFKDLDNRSVYDHLVTGGSTDNLIRFSGYDHTFWRIDGTIVPVGIRFDYISPNIHDGAYNIPKALEILKGRGDVTFVGRDIEVVEGAIKRVPYYNSDSGKSTYLEFFWTPTQEQAEVINTDEGDRFKVIFDNDMLGLRAGGAALYDSFYKSTEYVRSDDDDD